MQNGIATLENNFSISLKKQTNKKNLCNCHTTKQLNSSAFISKYENLHTHKNLHMNVYSNDSQKLGEQLSFNV